MGNTHQAQKSRLEADALNDWNAPTDYEWGYGKDRGYGPDTWWTQYPAASGSLQAPINISPEETEYEGTNMAHALKLEYPSGEGSKMVWNTGYSMQLEVRSGLSSCTVTGGPLKNSTYELREIHFHWGERDEFGSEHTINNCSSAMEIHFVHWNTDLFYSYEQAERSEGGLVILAVLVNLSSRCNSGIEYLASYAPKITFKRQYENISSSFDINRLLPRDLKKYWTYKGSLTTPPCYESVTWVIFQDTLNVTSSELALLRTMHNHCPNDRPPEDEHFGYILKNIRPIQPIGTRRVTSMEHSSKIGELDYEELLARETKIVSQFTSKNDFSWDVDHSTEPECYADMLSQGDSTADMW